MFLTIVRMLAKRREPRFIYRGKNRLVKKVKHKALAEMYRELELQEQNMLILRHPYLTVEQSHGHGRELRVPFDFKGTAERKRNEKFAKHLTWAEQLMHLKVQDAWE